MNKSAYIDKISYTTGCVYPFGRGMGKGALAGDIAVRSFAARRAPVEAGRVSRAGGRSRLISLDIPPKDVIRLL